MTMNEKDNEKVSFTSFGHFSDQTSDKYLHINTCGKLGSFIWPNVTIRPTGRQDYLLLYIYSGSCTLTLSDNRTRVVPRGNLILYKPGQPQDYRFRNEDNGSQIFVHFAGTGCEEILQRAGLESAFIIPVPQENEVEMLLLKMVENFDAFGRQDSLYCEGMLLAVFGLSAPRQTVDEDDPHTSYHVKILNDIISRIHPCPAEHVDLDAWSALTGLTKSYFIQLFKKATGMPPYRYLTHYRIQQARQLLLFSDLSVGEIGRVCGYPDYNYFSRLFKKMEGVSPSQFRAGKKEI